jgi:hypothetical protein
MIRFVPYVIRSSLRNRIRSGLTVLGVAVAVFLMTGLGALLESRAEALEGSSATTLVVSEKDTY